MAKQMSLADNVIIIIFCKGSLDRLRFYSLYRSTYYFWCSVSFWFLFKGEQLCVEKCVHLYLDVHFKPKNVIKSEDSYDEMFLKSFSWRIRWVNIWGISQRFFWHAKIRKTIQVPSASLLCEFEIVNRICWKIFVEESCSKVLCSR